MLLSVLFLIVGIALGYAIAKYHPTTHAVEEVVSKKGKVMFSATQLAEHDYEVFLNALRLAYRIFRLEKLDIQEHPDMGLCAGLWRGNVFGAIYLIDISQEDPLVPLFATRTVPTEPVLYLEEEIS